MAFSVGGGHSSAFGSSMGSSPQIQTDPDLDELITSVSRPYLRLTLVTHKSL